MIKIHNTCTFHPGFGHPLQDVPLHKCLPLSSACCFPVPGGSLLFHFVLPSCAGHPLDLFSLLDCHSVQRLVHLLSFILAICAAFSPSIVLHSCYVSGPFSYLFQLSVCIVWCQLFLFFSWSLSMVLYLVAYWAINNSANYWNNFQLPTLYSL